MGERSQLVELVRGGVGITQAAELFGVSRKTAHKWLHRAKTEGIDDGLMDRSRARLQQERFEGKAVALLTELRTKHPRWGPRTLLSALEEKYPRLTFPAASTVGDILKRAGLVQPRVRTPRFALPYLAGDTRPVKANDRWTADFKGQFRMRDGKLCYPFTLRDATSRMILDIRACTNTRAEVVISALEESFAKYGMPGEFHSDTGPPFGSTGLARLSHVSVFLLKHNVRPIFSRPGQPQDNGAHERMHLDLKAETTRPPGRHLRNQQQMFDAFLETYNEVRPHQALGGKPPRTQWTPSARRYTGTPPPPNYPGHFEVRRIDSTGGLYWHNEFVRVTRALSGESVGLEPVDEGLWRVHFASMCIGMLNDSGPTLRVVGVNRPPSVDADHRSAPPRP